MKEPSTPGGEPENEAEPEENDDPGNDPMAALIKRSLAGPVEGEGPTPNILRGVQRRIRRRSRGKFFADGWSTSDARVSHALIALAMLLVLLVAYFALGPVILP